MSVKPIFSLLFLTAAIPGALLADWPQFRGPDGQGYSNATGIPVEWSDTKNVKWKMPVPGQGYSSPVISGDQIWMTSAEKKRQIATRNLPRPRHRKSAAQYRGHHHQRCRSTPSAQRLRLAYPGTGRRACLLTFRPAWDGLPESKRQNHVEEYGVQIQRDSGRRQFTHPP